jgi:hypothetical protein
MSRTVGIDLGTTYSLIAYQDKREGRPKCIPGPYGTPLCPSVVSVDVDGSIIVGEAARRLGADEDQVGLREPGLREERRALRPLRVAHRQRGEGAVEPPAGRLDESLL